MPPNVPPPPDSSLLIDGDFILVRMALVDALDGNYDAAILLQRIAWRCERRPEGWRASREELAAETRLSLWRVRKAVKVLEDRGWLVSRRASTFDSVQVWNLPLTSKDAAPPRHGGSHHVEDVDSSTCDMEDSSMSDMVDSSMSLSSRDVETRERRGGRVASSSAPSGPAGAPPSRCEEHEGTTHAGACGACGAARRAREAWEREQKDARDTYVPTPACPAHGQPAGRCTACARDAFVPTKSLRQAMRDA